MDRSNNERVDMIEVYFLSRKNCTLAAETYAERYPERPTPDRRSFKKLVNNLREHGSFTYKKQRRNTVLTEDVKTFILAYFEAHPKKSVREADSELGINYETIRRVLHEFKYHAYKASVHQVLHPGDTGRRLVFCGWIAQEAANDPNFLASIIWTDESNFTNNGMMNRKNNHFWSKENPLIVIEGQNQIKFSINCWCAILNNRLLAVHLYPGTLTGARYVQFLEEVLIGALEDIPIDARQNLFFQQDGAPAHNSGVAREFLNTHFPDKWIGTAGPVEWPARSPDLSPLDFYLWGYLKDELYKTRYATVEEMMEKIEDILNGIHHNSLRKATQGLIKRSHACIYVDGDLFEHLL